MNITMYKSELLTQLKENRENHINEFAKQIQGWKKAMEKYNEEVKKWSLGISEDVFSKEKDENKPSMPYKPSSYMADYDRYLELLESHVPELIEIDEYAYDQIIKNKFNWSQGFLLASTTYVE